MGTVLTNCHARLAASELVDRGFTRPLPVPIQPCAFGGSAPGVEDNAAASGIELNEGTLAEIDEAVRDVVVHDAVAA